MSKFQHDVMLRIVKILNVLMIELPFAACWFLYYSHQTYANLAWEGHFAILGLFFILYIVLGKSTMRSGCRCSGSQNWCTARFLALWQPMAFCTS